MNVFLICLELHTSVEMYNVFSKLPKRIENEQLHSLVKIVSVFDLFLRFFFRDHN